MLIRWAKEIFGYDKSDDELIRSTSETIDGFQQMEPAAASAIFGKVMAVSQTISMSTKDVTACIRIYNRMAKQQGLDGYGGQNTKEAIKLLCSAKVLQELGRQHGDADMSDLNQNLNDEFVTNLGWRNSTTNKQIIGLGAMLGNLNESQSKRATLNGVTINGRSIRNLAEAKKLMQEMADQGAYEDIGNLSNQLSAGEAYSSDAQIMGADAQRYQQMMYNSTPRDRARGNQVFDVQSERITGRAIWDEWNRQLQDGGVEQYLLTQLDAATGRKGKEFLRMIPVSVADDSKAINKWLESDAGKVAKAMLGNMHEDLRKDLVSNVSATWGSILNRQNSAAEGKNARDNIRLARKAAAKIQVEGQEIASKQQDETRRHRFQNAVIFRALQQSLDRPPIDAGGPQSAEGHQ